MTNDALIDRLARLVDRDDWMFRADSLGLQLFETMFTHRLPWAWITDAPARTGVYLVYWPGDGTVLYVGQGIVRARLMDHRRKTNWGREDNCSVLYGLHPWEDLLRLENALIRGTYPLFNKQHNQPWYVETPDQFVRTVEKQYAHGISALARFFEPH